MEGGNSLSSLFTAISSVITQIITNLGTVATALMSNELFQIALGVVFFGIVMGVVYSLLRKVKKRGR